jgi:adenylylsulfate kinase
MSGFFSTGNTSITAECLYVPDISCPLPYKPYKHNRVLGVIFAVAFSYYMADHIHPVFEKLLSRSDKEKQLRQRAKVIWLTGLSGSGKSTIAQHLEKKLHREGFFTMVLDGDNIRTGINRNLGFSEDDRTENIRRIAEISKLFLNCGIITICCFVSPTRNIRRLARAIIGADDFLEIYVNAPLETCKQRDVKGLYEKAIKGEISDFTGIHQPFEPPENPALEINTDQQTIEQSVETLFNFLKQHITLSDHQSGLH